MSKLHLFTVALLFASVCHGSPIRDLQHELRINDSKWTVAHETDTEITWMTKDAEAVTLTIHHNASEITNPDDPKGLQAAFRDEAKSYKGGLVEVQIFKSRGIKCGLVTMKFEAATMGGQPGAMGYQMNAIIPMAHGTYVLQVAAVETGTTGAREALVVAIEAAKSGDPKAIEKASMRRDPYDAKEDAGALYTISDDRQWDNVAPNHPLTRIRKLMDSLIKTWKISDRIKRDALFKSQ